MAITATKPAIALREELNALRTPSGLKGQELLRADTVDQARAAIGAGRKNLIINGGFDVWQRGTSESGLTNGSDKYTADRWRWDERGNGTAVHTVSRSTNAPAGFLYSAKIHCTSTGSSGVYYFQQKIEGYNTYCTGWNTSTRKPITISFWLRCTKTGKFGGAITTSDESYGVAFDVDVSQADTWERYTVAVSAPPATNTLGTSGVGLILQFALATDVTHYRGPANTWHDNGSPLHTTDDATISLDQNGDIAYITGVQLELGSTATDFEHRSYGEELALCQRYYYQSLLFGSPANAVTACDIAFYHSYTKGANSWEHQKAYFPVAMRVAPSLQYSDGAGTTGRISHFTSSGGQATHGHTPYSSYSTPISLQVSDYSTGGIHGFSANFSADAEL